MNETKPLIKSKAFLLATIAVLLAIAGYLAEVIPGWAATIAVVVEFLQVLNRIVASSTIRGIIGLFIAISLGAAMAPAEIADAGIFRKADGSWRTPVRSFLANRAQAREARGAVALFPGLRASACSSCSVAASPAAAASDCVECVQAERVAAAANASRNRLDLGIFRLASTLSMRRDLTAEERGVVRRLLVDREFRLHVGEALKARYGNVGDGTLLQILQFIIQNRTDIKEFIKMLIEIAALF